MKQNIFLSGVLLLAMACAARSDVTVYSDRASFEAAIGPSVTYTFEVDDGFPAAPAYITSFGPVAVNEFSPIGGPAYIRNFPDGTANQTLSGEISALNSNNTGLLYAAFISPEYAMGFDVFPMGVPVVVDVQYEGTNPSSVSYVLDGDQSVSGDASLFFGLTSTDPILNFTVGSLADPRVQVYKGIDNLTIVPESATIWPLVIAGLFSLRRR
ncbi:MAG TPA: hypothetical protein VG722_12455 [Tepidisphaeraceae bacterium]|nr:hypothetical protein [Tepidisphaeraceae bacterium]